MVRPALHLIEDDQPAQVAEGEPGIAHPGEAGIAHPGEVGRLFQVEALRRKAESGVEE